VTDSYRLTGWELDQLRASAEQREIVDVAGRDLLALVDEAATARRRSPSLWASLWVLPFVAGTLGWLWSGDWRWMGSGLLGVLVVSVVGAAVDGKRGAR
jgi:hypothetical protein